MGHRGIWGSRQGCSRGSGIGDGRPLHRGVGATTGGPSVSIASAGGSATAAAATEEPATAAAATGGMVTTGSITWGASIDPVVGCGFTLGGGELLGDSPLLVRFLMQVSYFEDQ